MGQTLKQWPGRSTNGRPRSFKGCYIMRETFQGKGIRNSMEGTLQHKKLKIMIKSWEDIFKNYSSRTLPRRDFFAKDLFSFLFVFAFLLSLVYYKRCPIHGSLVFQPTLQKFIMLSSLGLSPSLIWAQEPKPALTIFFS